MTVQERLIDEMKRVEELGRLAVSLRAFKQAKIFSNALYAARVSMGNEKRMNEEASKLARLRQAYERPVEKLSRISDAKH